MKKGYRNRNRNILKIHIVNFVCFNNKYLIKLCQIIIYATNTLKA